MAATCTSVTYGPILEKQVQMIASRVEESWIRNSWSRITKRWSPFQLSRINRLIVVLAVILTLYVFLNGLVYLYTISIAFTAQIIYTVYRPFGPKTRAKKIKKLNKEIKELNDTIDDQRSIINVFLKTISGLRDRLFELAPSETDKTG